MRRCALLLAVTLAACGGSTEPKPAIPGPLKLGIVSGQGQVVTAGSSQLGAPVVGRLVRQANGQVAWQRLERVGSWLIPPAYAQGGTVVTGSPVPGAVVCAVSVDSVRHLTPWTPCTNTDSEGKATFFFTPGTKAGEALAEIRGTVEQSPAVFDTARAVITAGAVDTLRTWSAAVFPGESFPASALISHAADRYGNAIANPTVTVTLPDGWTLADGMITAPAHEAYDWITVAAGAASMRNSFKVVRDLSAYAWDATWACRYSGGIADGRGVNVDSIAYAVALDPIQYKRADVSAPASLRQYYLTLDYTGRAIRYMHDGVADTAQVRDAIQTVEQGPDSLRIAEGAAVRTGDAPLAYEGGRPVCPAGWVSGYRPFRMVAR